MMTRNFFVSGLAGLVLAAPSLAQIVRPVEADFASGGQSGDERIVLVTDAGQPGVAGTGGVYLGVCDIFDFLCVYAPTSGPGALRDPHAAEALGNGEVAIADTGNNRVLIVNQAGQVTWNSASVTFSDGKALSGPVDVQLIPDGTPSLTDNPILIACRGNNRVVAVKRTGQVVWSMNAGLNAPLKAERLPNGNTMIVESQRVIVVNTQKQVVQSFTSFSGPTPVIADARRLPDGSTLILDAGSGTLILYGPTGSFVSNIGSSGLDGLIGATDMDGLELENGGLDIVTTTPEGLWLNPQTY